MIISLIWGFIAETKL